MYANLKALCCACVCFFFIPGIAADNSKVVGGPQNEKSNASAVTGGEKVIGGPIATINAEKKELSVLRNNEPYPIQVTSSTKIVSGKDPIDFSSLSVGDKVTVNYIKSSNGTRNAVTVERKSSGSTGQGASGHAKKKTHDKSVSPKTEAPAAPKAEVKAEPKKVETPAAAPATSKVEVKAELKKAETPEAPVKPETKPAPK